MLHGIQCFALPLLETALTVITPYSGTIHVSIVKDKISFFEMACGYMFYHVYKLVIC